ncbi:hypothetical protein BTO05_08095 [Winogradskyella sp. PC-19]|uniref:T9SS type B sorting domain-containing protein n=1 Tax=unclassified Winogradskyella TaxID=2615021 RepID=UPI000B3C6277|nr:MULTISPECIES: T9SS type B sorting domain-containing protein [unclassified Winogradskyella]ARV09601.1 hypothetical protein BTO05_08095 [Winogradskyella sp. PC-19]
MHRFLKLTITILLPFFCINLSWSQTVLFADVPVSDTGTSNGIGQANTSRNIAVSNDGIIYVVFSGDEGVRVAKSDNRGASFSPSVQVSTETFVEPEIEVNDQGVVFIVWASSGNSNIFLSRSLDNGLTFSVPTQVNSDSNFAASIHMTTYGDNVYIVNQSGQNIYVNSNNGVGSFTSIDLPVYVYADILTDQNGVVYAPRDNPALELYNSVDDGQSFNQIPLTNDGDIYFSSYTLSDGPCGTFLFTSGDGSNAYKIDVTTGVAEQLVFGINNSNVQGRTLFADQQGTIIDGYKADSGDLVMSISFDQGQNFETPIIISDGDSHNIDRNTNSNDIVVTYSKNGQVFVTVYTDLLKDIQIVEPIPAIETCSGTSFDLDFNLTGQFGPSTLFTAVLSDETGSFANSTNVGQVVTNTNNTVTVTLPGTLVSSNLYRLLIESLADCTQSQPITISIGNVQLGDADDISECAEENGSGIFDLNALIPDLLNGQTGIDITFHESETDADSNVNPIPNPEAYTTTGTTIWVRGQSIQSSTCFGSANIELTVFDLPVINNNVALEQCDTDQDGITLFNLTEANSLITSETTYSFSYYTSENDAEMENTANEILNFTSYENPTALTSVVYARAETSNGCFRISQIDLFVEATQIPNDFEIIYETCDDVLLGTNIDGVSAFDFSDATAQIESLFPVGQNLETTYYFNENDALGEINAINNLTDFRNEQSPNSQIIWVRVDNQDNNGCQGLGPHIILNVLSVPENNSIVDYELCSSNGEATFDLTTKDAEVINTQTEVIIVKYYNSQQNALDDIPITNPNTFLSTGQTIYVRAVFDTNGNSVEDNEECFNAIDMSFQLIVNPNPVIFEPDAIEICSVEVNTIYDLTERESQITGNDTSVTINYYETQTDLDNNIPINDPQNYLNTQLSRDIIVVVTNGNNCTSQETLTLITTLYDNYNTSLLPLEECEVDNDGFDNFDITRAESDILNLLDTDTTNDLSASDYTFTYYELESFAAAEIENTNNSISNPTSFINTVITTQTIYVRVTPANGSNQQCFVVIPVTLVVNPVPPIEIEDNYVICLSNADQVIDSDTTVLPMPPIDTQLNTTEYTFQWYAGTEQETIDNPLAIVIAGETGPTFSPTQADNYTVIATNNATGCTISATTNVSASYPPESITVELISTAFSGNNTLEASVIGNGDYEFSLDNGPYQASGIFTDVTGGLHQIFVRDLYNCNIIAVTKSIIDYPLYFTPNNDGNHDTWNITSIASQPNAKIYVFDRYGKLLKQLSPTGAGWDGTYNGNNMPTSDYWFSVEYTEPLDGIKRTFKAHFTLKR